MSNADPRSLMYEIVAIRGQINSVSQSINSDKKTVFNEISLAFPNLAPSELGFIRSVSWLYVLYFEVGRVYLEFLSERIAAYNIDPNGELSEHITIVQSLRTYLQHNLDSQKLHNRRIQESCEQWLKSKCGTPLPGDEDHWLQCLIGLLEESKRFLDAILKCLRLIEQDDSREQILNDLNNRIKRYHPPEEFDRLISIVAGDLGRDTLDVVRLRKRYYDDWVNTLSLYNSDYNFDVDARKLIERVLLDEATPIIPITGSDVMREFDISPGPEVGKILKQARAIYSENPCPRDTLLRLLREQIGQKES